MDYSRHELLVIVVGFIVRPECPILFGVRCLRIRMGRHLFDKWLSVAEAKAELSKLDGSLWHAYRRKWASERKHFPLKDVADAGGWKDVNTLLEIYQQADEESVLAVMSETRKLHERGVA